MVMLIVEPGVQPVVVKSNSPCGKLTPAGAVPAGGLPASPSTLMYCAVPNTHEAPPPVKLAVIVPVPVAEGPAKVGGGAAGVTEFDAAEAAPVPTPLVAVTLNVYAVPLVRPGHR